MAYYCLLSGRIYISIKIHALFAALDFEWLVIHVFAVVSDLYASVNGLASPMICISMMHKEKFIYSPAKLINY